MNSTAIEVRGLSKLYSINPNLRHTTLRDSMASGLFSRFNRRASKVRTDEAQSRVWALKEIDFDIKKGEVVGVIGRNGAGKSTLLKILSRITEPSFGYAEIRGRVGSLLEVGAGFHPELTGRENIYLNSAILGMKKAEIDLKLDEIIAFAELERFIDTAVKHYSSGMYMRLAFSVAAHLETEVLLVDEVLAVGDAAFQKRCLGKMEDVARAGRTVVFVSHNMGAVRGLCEKAMWLDGGELKAQGEVYEVVESYLATLSENGFRHENKSHGLVVEDVVVKNASGERTLCFRPGEELNIEICFDAKNPIKEPYLNLAIRSIHGTCFTANMFIDGCRPKVLQGRSALTCSFKSIPLLPQNYTIQMAIRASEGRDAIVAPQDVASFSVVGTLEDYGMTGEHIHGVLSKTFPVVIPYEWTLPDGRVSTVELVHRGRPKTMRSDEWSADARRIG
jgi:lipopolysaccharide transport system ATP-binding protein